MHIFININTHEMIYDEILMCQLLISLGARGEQYPRLERPKDLVKIKDRDS